VSYRLERAEHAALHPTSNTMPVEYGRTLLDEIRRLRRENAELLARLDAGATP
jgi:hypothetical protein